MVSKTVSRKNNKLTTFVCRMYFCFVFLMSHLSTLLYLPQKCLRFALSIPGGSIYVIYSAVKCSMYNINWFLFVNFLKNTTKCRSPWNEKNVMCVVLWLPFVVKYLKQNSDTHEEWNLYICLNNTYFIKIYV